MTHDYVFQDLVEDSEDDRGFDEISESAPPIELPAAELARLEVGGTHLLANLCPSQCQSNVFLDQEISELEISDPVLL